MLPCFITGNLRGPKRPSMAGKEGPTLYCMPNSFGSESAQLSYQGGMWEASLVVPPANYRVLGSGQGQGW